MPYCILGVALVAFVGTSTPIEGLSCHSGFSPSILSVIAESDIVVIGHCQYAVKPSKTHPQGHTELVIDNVLKGQKAIGEMKKLKLNGFVDSQRQFIVVAHVEYGRIYPFLGPELDADGEIERFVRGALRLKDQSLAARLTYAGPFLHNANRKVAEAAQIEVAQAAYTDLREVARKMDPEGLVKAIQDSRTSSFVLSTYVSLLGHCGKKEHAVVIRKLLDADNAEHEDYAHRLNVAYLILDPDGGRKRLIQVLKNAEGSLHVRYVVFHSIRKMRASRPELISHRQAKVMAYLLLPDPWLADYAIEELRLLKCWDACDDVLALLRSKEPQTPLVTKAILRYALQCPNPQAKAHVIQMQAQNAEWVQDTRELLELETEPQPKQK